MKKQILYAIISLAFLNVAVSCRMYSLDLASVQRGFDSADGHAQRGDCWGAYRIDEIIVIELASVLLNCDKNVARTVISKFKKLLGELEKKDRYQTESGRQKFLVLERFVNVEAELLEERK